MSTMSTEEIYKITDIGELDQIIAHCQGRKDDMREEARAAAEEEIAAIAEKAGLTVAEITGLRPAVARKTATGKKPAGKASKAPPKYKDPESGKTWTGRGKPPNWVRDHVNGGGDKEDFLIPESERKGVGKGDM